MPVMNSSAEMSAEIEEIPSFYVGENTDQARPVPKARSTVGGVNGAQARDEHKVGWAEIPPPDPSQQSTTPQVHPLPTPSPALSDALTGRVLSPDASSQSSTSVLSSLRRTASSDQSSIRTRIRQKAKSSLDRKRGSIQLTKRLLRNQALQNAVGQSVSERNLGDIVAVDDHIKRSIQKAAKYVTTESSCCLAPELVQEHFFLGQPTQHGESRRMEPLRHAPVRVRYGKPKPTSRDDREKFASSLDTYRRTYRVATARREEVEDPTARLRSEFSATLPARIADILSQRMGSTAVGLAATIRIPDTPRCTEDFDEVGMDGEREMLVPMVYRKAERWDGEDAYGLEEGLDQRWGPEREDYSRLIIDVNHVEFSHHWLFSVEDSLAHRVREIYDEHCRIVEDTLHHVHQYLRLKQQMDALISAEGEGIGELEEEMACASAAISAEGAELAKVARMLDDQWDLLERWRDRTRTNLTRIVLRRSSPIAAGMQDATLSGGLTDDASSERSVLAFLQSPLYVLKETRSGKEEKGVQGGSERSSGNRQQERDAAVEKCMLQLQLYFNNRLVATSEAVRLEPRSFVARVATIYNLRVFERMEELKLTLRERFGRAPWQDIACVFIPLPDDDSDTTATGTNADKPLSAIEFGSNVKRAGLKGSIGAGVPGVSPFISGKLFCTAQWHRNGGGRRYSVGNAKAGISSPEPFHLVPPEVGLVAPPLTSLGHERGSEARLDRLRRRFQQRYTVGISASERGGDVSDSDMEQSAGIVQREGRAGTRAHQDGNDYSSLDAHRRAGHSRAVMLRRQLVENSAVERRLMSHLEIVREEPIPTLSIAFGAMFGPPDLSRKLKPQRNTLPGRAGVQFGGGGVSKLLINIQQANNLPERTSGEPLRAFVEASFQNQHTQTTVVEGRHASWQEALYLNISPGGDHRERGATASFDFKQISADTLELHLYDQVTTQLDFDDREVNTVHQQVERRWLGAVKIPFSSIYALGKIDGTLGISTPLFHTGHKPSGSGGSASSTSAALSRSDRIGRLGGIVGAGDRHPTIKLLVTIDPPPALMPQLMPYSSFPISDDNDRSTVSRAVQWEERLRNRFPDRHFLALANSSTGKRVLAPRFLRKVAPPAKILELAAVDQKRAVTMATRLISSIPFVADPVMFPGQSDVWCTSDEMMRMGCGDDEEHAILLVCWLLSLSIPAVLVLGAAYPEGARAAYVLVQFEDAISWLVNPSSGRHYAPDDPTCPLISVGTIVTSNNVYGNTQRAVHPSQLDFDLPKRAHWEPLLAGKSTDFSSIQPEYLKYDEVDADLIVELRATLEREIRLKFDEARPYGIPQWNLLASRALREILNDICSEEEGGVSTNGQSSIDVESRLHQLRHGYRVTAFAFRQPYISKEALMAEVLKTGVHMNADRGCQFALAVHVHPFINRIVSCSVAMATLRALNG